MPDEVTNEAHQPSPRADLAFEALFRAHHDDLMRYALRRVDPDAAADVVADVFLVAWRRRGDLPPGVERLWLFGVAAKVIGNERRAAVRRLRLVDRARADSYARSAEVPAIHDDVRAALAALSVAEQEVLLLTEWDRLDAGEAAQILGCSRATFRVRLHRARRRFAAQLAALQQQEGEVP